MQRDNSLLLTTTRPPLRPAPDHAVMLFGTADM
jgi:hypothetical protein